MNTPTTPTLRDDMEIDAPKELLKELCAVHFPALVTSGWLFVRTEK
jgi:hypothetical protein